MFLLGKPNYTIIVNIGPILTVMHKLPATLDAEAGSKFLQEDRFTPFLKTKTVHVSKPTKTHDTNDKPLRNISSIKLYVYVCRMTRPVSFLECKRLADPAILKCDFCDQFAVCIYPKTRLVEVTDASTEPIVWHYDKQRSATTTNTKVVPFPK